MNVTSTAVGKIWQGSASLALLLVSCVPNLQSPTGTQLSCTSDGDCPGSLVCQGARCIDAALRDQEAPRFVSAAAQDEGSVLLVFSESAVLGAVSITPDVQVLALTQLAEEGKFLATIDAMRAGAQYTVTVASAVDAVDNTAGEQRAAFIGVGIVPDLAPPQPLAPVDAVVRAGDVALQWTLRAGAHRYTVQVTRDAAFAQIERETTVDAPRAVVTLSEAGTWYWRVNSDLSAAADAKFDLLGDRIYVACPTPPCSDQGAIGHAQKPFGSINAAIARAKALGLARVDVTANAYKETLVAFDGVSVFGGYDAAFATVTGRTTLTAPSGDYALLAIDVSSPMQIDSFTLHASGPLPTVRAARSAMTLSRSLVTGGGATVVLIETGAGAGVSRIEHTTVTAGDHTGDTYAVRAVGPSVGAVEIIGSDIVNTNATCVGSEKPHGMFASLVNVSIRESRFFGGDCGGTSSGLWLDNSGGIITRTSAIGGKSLSSWAFVSGQSTFGAKAAARLLLLDNVFGGTPAHGIAGSYVGAKLAFDDFAMFNTFIGGARPDATSSLALEAGGSLAAASISLVNNVFVTENAGTCLRYEKPLARAFSNVFVGCADTRVEHVNSCSGCTSPCVGAPASACLLTAAEINADLSAPTGARENDVVSSIGAAAFDAWHPTNASPDKLKAGAITDPVVSGCATVLGCSHATEDFDGDTSQRMSVGAFEL